MCKVVGHIYWNGFINNFMKEIHIIEIQLLLKLNIRAHAGGGGGGLTQKCRTCMGVGGCFRDPKHKSNMYTFVQQRGGVHILSRITKV